MKGLVLTMPSLNTQTKIALVLFTNIMVFFHLPIVIESSYLILLLLILASQKEWRRIFIYVSIYLSILLLSRPNFLSQLPIIGSIIGFYTLTVRRLFPLTMMAGFLIKSTPVSSLIYTLRKWKIPEFIIIPLSVLFRFFPTLRKDYQQIRSAMKFRGIAVTNWEMARHPLQTLEYILIPLLMNASVTALDLSSAALTRGINHPAISTSIYQKKMTFFDWMIITILIIFLIGGLSLWEFL